MFFCISNKIRKIAKLVSAEYADSEQNVYTNPGQEYPDDISYDVWPGEQSFRDNDPASKKDDESRKWDTIRQGPGPLQTDWDEKGNRPNFFEDPDPPKTDSQNKVFDVTKPKGEDYPDQSDENELDRETWVGEGIVDSFPF